MFDVVLYSPENKELNMKQKLPRTRHNKSTKLRYDPASMNNLQPYCNLITIFRCLNSCRLEIA